MVRRHNEDLTSVLVYSPDAGSRPGHSFMYAAVICQLLAEAGRAVTLLTTRGFVRQYIESYGDSPPFKVFEGVSGDLGERVLRDNTWQMIRYLSCRIILSMKSLFRLSQTLQRGRYPVLHWLDNPELFSTLCFGLLFRLQGHHKSTRWFLNLHPGDISFRAAGGHFLRRLYKGFSGCALKFLLRRGFVRAVFVHGEYIKNSLVSAWGGEEFGPKVIVAHYGVGGPLSKPRSRAQARQILGIPEDAFVVLSFGMIRRDKHIEDIIQAVSLVEGAVLLVAGMPLGVEEHEIRGWVEDAGIADRCLLHLTYVAESDIPTYFSAANVAVLAHREGFPGQSGPLNLACAFSVPVVVSDVGDIGSVVRQNGLGHTFPPRDWRALARKLCDIQTNGPPKGCRENLQEYAEKHSWNQTVLVYLKAYESLGGSDNA